MFLTKSGYAEWEGLVAEVDGQEGVGAGRALGCLFGEFISAFVWGIINDLALVFTSSKP